MADVSILKQLKVFLLSKIFVCFYQNTCYDRINFRKPHNSARPKGVLTMDRPATGRELLFQFHGVPPIGTSVSLALQHLVAMIVGCVTPPS